MIKIIDLDSLFDKYIEGYVYKNVGKVKPEEIENNIPVLYQKFGDEKLAELDGLTPNEYYKNFSVKELLKALETHLDKGVSVSDFLCEAIVSKTEEHGALKEAISQDKSEQFTLYVMNFIEEANAEIDEQRFLEFMLLDYAEPIKELAVEMLTKKSDKIKDRLCAEYESAGEKTRACIAEILAHVKLKEDRVFDILIKEFLTHPKQIPFYVNLLAKYGDERAVPFIKAVIEKDDISYADFEELRFALEVFGEVYDVERDFSKDRFYAKIKGKRATENSQNKK